MSTSLKLRTYFVYFLFIFVFVQTNNSLIAETVPKEKINLLENSKSSELSNVGFAIENDNRSLIDRKSDFINNNVIAYPYGSARHLLFMANKNAMQQKRMTRLLMNIGTCLTVHGLYDTDSTTGEFIGIPSLLFGTYVNRLSAKRYAGMFSSNDYSEYYFPSIQIKTLSDENDRIVFPTESESLSVLNKMDLEGKRKRVLFLKETAERVKGKYDFLNSDTIFDGYRSKKNYREFYSKAGLNFSKDISVSLMLSGIPGVLGVFGENGDKYFAPLFAIGLYNYFFPMESAEEQIYKSMNFTNRDYYRESKWKARESNNLWATIHIAQIISGAAMYASNKNSIGIATSLYGVYQDG